MTSRCSWKGRTGRGGRPTRLCSVPKWHRSATLSLREAASGCPKYRTGLRTTNDAFLKAIGIEAKEIFAPSDMETDSRFEIVAEWRNLGKTQRSRMTDSVITQIYWAMDEKSYALRTSAGVAVKLDIAYAGRRLPLFSSLLKERFPKNMPRSTL